MDYVNSCNKNSKAFIEEDSIRAFLFLDDIIKQYIYTDTVSFFYVMHFWGSHAIDSSVSLVVFYIFKIKIKKFPLKSKTNINWLFQVPVYPNPIALCLIAALLSIVQEPLKHVNESNYCTSFT